jgi:hypothetical protein
MTDTIPVARVTLDAIYSEVQGLRADVTRLQSDLPHHVTLTKGKQEEYDDRLANHGKRIFDLEHRVTQLEGQVKPRAPWYAVVGAVAAILTSGVTVITLITIASKIGAALG